MRANGVIAKDDDLHEFFVHRHDNMLDELIQLRKLLGLPPLTVKKTAATLGSGTIMHMGTADSQ